MTLFDLTQALIKLPSPTGSEHAVVNFLRGYLEAAGFAVQLQEVNNGRANIYARVGEPVFLEALEGFESTVVAFTTDIPLLTNWGKPLLLGPSSILDAHTPHERIAKTELARAVEIYCQIVKILLDKAGFV